ncbi:hypothetical protein HDU76_011960 [Blyttiomyces sp. JEL0837]|nr:hypothetical protein HDU76_011960 [Blyttiomyces sp. JEL0837]
MFEKGVTSLDEGSINGSDLKVLIVHTRWNFDIVKALTDKAIETLKRHGVSESNISVHDVPGAFELPFATQALLSSGAKRYDVAISIGVLIKGETMHFEYIADAASHGIMRVGLETKIPVIFGLLTCLNDAQALSRAGLGPAGNPGHNHGEDWGKAAVEMGTLVKRSI